MLGWSFCLLLKIFSRVISLSKVTNFSGLTTCPAIFFYLNAGYLDSLIFLSLLIHALNMMICSGGFLGSPLLFLTKKNYTKGVDIGGPWLGIRSSFIKGAGIESAYI